MWHLRRRSNLSVFSFLLHHHMNSTLANPKKYIFPITSLNLTSIESWGYALRFWSSSLFPPLNHVNITVVKSGNSEFDDVDDKIDSDGEGDEVEIGPVNLGNERLVRDVKIVMDALREFRTNLSQVKSNLENCNVTLSSELVTGVLSRLNSDWEVAFTFFLWAVDKKQHLPGYEHSLREYHAMIYILGKARKFDTAWSLIDEMRRRKENDGTTSLVTPHTLLIMIRRYCAVHNVGMAINTFYAHKKFGFAVGIEEFQNLLNALCRYKNVEDAEHLLFCNRNVFPFNTKSFNIILNGWCNVIPSPREGERFWLKMIKWGIPRDVISYASMISCYSKSKNLNKVLKLFDQMKQMNISPDRKVYNAIIHALTKAGHVKEALNLIKKMEEKNINPNAVTYNSLIKPLCKSGQMGEAREVFDHMLNQGVSPTVQTYHAFFRTLKTVNEVFMLLDKMSVIGCRPSIDTYIMLIRKFCRWRQLEDAFKLWNHMINNGICPDRSAYIVLIHGLFLNGKLDEAYKYYAEMKEKQLIQEPNIDKKLQAWVSGKPFVKSEIKDSVVNEKKCSQLNETSKITLKDVTQESVFIPELSRNKNLPARVSSKPIASSGIKDSKVHQAECIHLSNKPKTTLKNLPKESALRRKPETKTFIRRRGFSFYE